jgi:dihydroneopterin aldolase
VGEPDQIQLRGLRILGRCGVLAHEQAQDQPFEFDLDLVSDLRAAGESDELTDTVDYGAVCQLVEETVRSRPVALLEHLASRVADAVLATHERVESVTVAARKLRPPVPQDLATSAVRIERHRGAS